jgi:hypothetical protein
VVSILTKVQAPAICGAKRAGRVPNPKGSGPEGLRPPRAEFEIRVKKVGKRKK